MEKTYYEIDVTINREDKNFNKCIKDFEREGWVYECYIDTKDINVYPIRIVTFSKYMSN